MFCKKCGTEINDDSKYCPKCGTKLVNETSVPSTEPISEKSFFKKNKKILIGCCIGLIVIFLLVAFLSSDKVLDAERLYLKFYDDLGDEGYVAYMKEKNDTHILTKYVKDNSNILVEINEGDVLDEWIVDESQKKTINGIDGYYTKYDGLDFFVYNDNNCTISISSNSMDGLELAVKDY